MMEGNRGFVEGRAISFKDSLKMLKEMRAENQEPLATVLYCADSRVPAELVFDRSNRRLFVTRVEGNIASSEIIAGLEYEDAVLGTNVITVLVRSD
jgi:carbonic anhydrase